MDDSTAGPWIGWNGGECPVHPKIVVEVSYGTKKEIREPIIFSWRRRSLPVICKCVVKEHKEPREMWLALRDDGSVAWSYNTLKAAIDDGYDELDLICMREVIKP